ncbi:12023_t:CDS:10 [Cetraspora pellucida]|uniref:12023_t:CDS:1 n=1 Tax=Cetraspora pellucida TaxID=1433469 RepID=A0ACA9LKE6_9GLOM|nr:12023_t:CDS:10 [Cetraspora pellucida]
MITERFVRSSVELEAELRQLSKQKPPFDKQVATVRTKQVEMNSFIYVGIIFLDYEFAQSKEVEQNLWKYVYYKFIEEFRKRIRTAVTSGGKSKGIHRKLTSSFRSFLQEATGFYYSFIQRLAAHFELKQLDPIIQKFGLTIGIIFDSPTNVSQHSYSDDIKQKAVLSCHKSLIFLGDLARYRELQTEKPRKNWSIACDYYNHARHLVPESGNPHNQLAVIATYSADEFSAVYHYYRSLVVRCPFLTAKDNISLLFHKARKSSADAPEKIQEAPQRDQKENGGRRRFSHQRQVSSAAQSAKIRTGEATQAFFSDFIRLHSILYFRTDLESYSELKSAVLNQLKESVLSLALDPDQLLKFTAINMAASFVIRHIANGDSNNVNQSPKVPISYSTASKKALVEKYAVLLTLDTLSTLLDLCNSELLDVVVEYSDQRHNAVQILPAPVKRSLISLRVGTKWVYSSLEHLSSISALIEKDPNVKNEFANIARFWQRFAEFLNSLERLFPHSQGIPLDVPLAEDLELTGFSGLKNHTFMNGQIFLNQGEPFEELDMRIYDIFEDACKISESEHSQLFYIDGVFSSGTPPSKAASPASSLSPVQNQITDQSYVEDKFEAPITDLIADPYETNLAESQSFAAISPKKLTNDSSEDGDSEDEVILFTGRHSSVIENNNANGLATSEKSSPRPTTAEVLLTQVLKSNKSVSSTLPITNSNNWNQFNTTQLFPNNNDLNVENVETKQQNFLEFLYPVTRPSTNLNGNTSAYSQTAFSAHTTISGVPNASQDPLVPSTKRLSGEFNSITPHQQSTAISSASLFAFPGTDGGVSQFGLFGDPNTSLIGFSGTAGHNSAKSGLSAINPPPGFSSESSAFDLHRHNQQNNQSLFQPSNVFGFSSFDMSTQFPWKQREYVNGLSDGNLQMNGTTGLSDH